MNLKHPVLFSVIFLLVVVGTGALVEAKTLHVAVANDVANDGADSITCGSKNQPCRSISQAMADAS